MSLESPGRLLDRFHGVLLSEIRDRRPEYLSDSFTVAEIYQHLVPYASHRDRLGVEINGDYEDVLLRLLAGEGDYLDLESAPARERLREELESPNPDTSLYREYAAASVRLNPDRLPGEAPVEDAEADDEEPGDAVEPAGDEEPVVPAEVAPEAPVETPEPPPEDAPEAGPVAGAEADPSSDEPGEDPEGAGGEGGETPGDAAESSSPGDDGTCAWCREELPERENLNYCPFCGTDVGLVPCPECGEALEPRWRFCIACGNAVTGSA